MHMSSPNSKNSLGRDSCRDSLAYFRLLSMAADPKKPGDKPEASDKKDDADSAKKGLTPEQKAAFMRELVEIGKKIGVDPAMLRK